MRGSGSKPVTPFCVHRVSESNFLVDLCCRELFFGIGQFLSEDFKSKLSCIDYTCLSFLSFDQFDNVFFAQVIIDSSDSLAWNVKFSFRDVGNFKV